MEKLFNSKTTPHCSFKPDDSKLEQLAKDLAQFGLEKSSLYKSITIQKVVVEEMDKDPYVIPTEIEKIFYQNQSVAHIKCNDSIQQQFYDENVVCEQENIKEIFTSTLDQSKSKKWFLERKVRISASRAHSISNARKKETSLKYFFESMFDSANLRYGREMEPIARSAYKQLTANEVYDSGLVIQYGHPWICSSPDGLIKDANNEILCLEIKCPSSCKDKNIVVPFIVNNQLKKSHQYFTQVQVQMFCCNLKMTHLFIYSSCDQNLICVPRDDIFL